MSADPDHPAERFLAALPGWLFLVAALALLAMVIVTPPWLAVRELAWQRELMRAQVERLERQHDRYGYFHAALRNHDPVLLERLAYTQLRLKPTDKQMLAPPTLAQADGGRANGRGGTSLHAASLALAEPAEGSRGRPAAALPSASVEAWLSEPLPIVGVDLPFPRSIETRLTRLTAGRSRVGLLLAGLACLLAAVWPRAASPADGG